MAPAFLTIEETLQLTGMRRSTYYDRRARGVFPEPVRVGQREVVYPAEVITAWMTANRSSHRDPVRPDPGLRRMTA